MDDDHIHADTPMGAQLNSGGATFRTWAPRAKEVYVVLHHFDVKSPAGWNKNDHDLLIRDANGYWAGFFPGVVDGSEYRFWIVGQGSEGFKRDPYARELQMHGYPDCNCIVRDPNTFPCTIEISGSRPSTICSSINSISACSMPKTIKAGISGPDVSRNTSTSSIGSSTSPI